MVESTVCGPSVQAGSIQGGIHIHEAPFVPPIPRQLLPVSASFTDRIDDLDTLTTALNRLPTDTVRIAAISGQSGIGKSALASRLLHQLSPHFTGGQLYADVRGYAPEGPASTAEILGRFLRAVRPGAQPASIEELAGWWRSATAANPDRPVCVLLDNAVHADQIRALLPGGPGHLIVATSRSILADLARDGSVLHRLGPLDSTAALDYLTSCLGEERVTRERQAALQLADLCAGLPMALTLVVTELAAHPDRALADAVAAFGETHRPHPRPVLNPLETAVPSALDHAYESLPRDTPASRAYRLLSRLFVLDFDCALTSAVCNLTTSAAEEALRTLHGARLIEQAPGDEDSTRGRVYRFHDAARVHAEGRASQEATPGEGEEALRRALDFFLWTATQAEYQLTDTHRRLARTYEYRPAEPVHFASDDAAMAWLEAQRHNLLAAIHAANEAGTSSAVWQLAHALWPLLRASHDYVLWFESHDLGLKAARRCGDKAAEMEMLSTWGVGERGAGLFPEAARKFNALLELARAERDGRAEAQALHELGSVLLHGGKPTEAEDFLRQAREQRAELGRTSESERDRLTYTRAVAITDICLGQALLELGRPPEAIETLAAARTTLVEVKDPFDAARALAWLGRAHAAGGDPGKGELYGRRAVAECDATGSARWSAHSRELLGHTVRDSGQHDLARSLYEESVGIYSAVSRRDEERVRQALQGLS